MIIRLQILPHSSLPPTPKPHKTLTPFKPFHSTTTSTTTTTTTSTTTTTTDAGLLFREKIIYLQTLNVNPTKALLKNPNLRSTPLSTIQSVEHCLSSMGIEPSALGRILDMLPTLLTSDPYLHLYPILDFLLHDVQIPYHDIRKCIIRCPRILLCDVDKQLKPTLEFLKNLGFVEQNRITCQTTLLLVSSVEHTLMPKIQYLMALGFDFDEVANMVLRSPGLLTFSIENNYKPKLEYFVEEMNGDIRELQRFPQYFSFSLEGKIKPRHRLLVEHGCRMSLSEMLKVSDGEFNVRLIEKRLRLTDKRLL